MTIVMLKSLQMLKKIQKTHFFKPGVYCNISLTQLDGDMC